jgi:hypothetical protein
MHIEIQTFSTTAAPTVAGATATAFSGDSATIRNGKGHIGIIAAWASANTNPLITQIVYPSGHDTTRNYRVVIPAGPQALGLNTAPFTLPLGSEFTVQPQELITTTNFSEGAATAGDIQPTSYLVHYADFPGIDARLISAQELESRTDKITTVVSFVTDTATAAYVEEGITVDSDLLRANRDYAVVGITANFPSHALTFFSPDNGNTRTGMPGFLRNEIGCQWFPLLARTTGLKAIPVFNSGNKGQVRVGFVGDENLNSRYLTLHLALLK